MNIKNLGLAVLISFVLVGCVSQKTPANEDSAYKNVPISDQVNEKPLNSGDLVALRQKCDTLGSKDCHNLASDYYGKGDFKTAINLYDIGCSTYQYLPSCIQMGKMFERGEGVKVNKAVALDIYERACYSGHKPSCSDMKRLQ